MKMNTKNLGILALSVVLVIGVVFLSGCIGGGPSQEEGNITNIDQQEGGHITDTGQQEEKKKEVKQDDAGLGRDATGELESPESITYGEYKGILYPGPDKYGDGGDIDAYGLKWNPGDTVEVTVTPNKGLDIQFGGVTNGHPSKISTQNEGVKGEVESITMIPDATSDITRFSIWIGSVSGSGEYTLKITKTAQNDGDKGQDAPTNWDQPLLIDEGNYGDCYLGSVDESDDYAIKLQAGQRAVVKVIPSETLDVSVGKTEFEVENTNDNLKGEAEEITINADESGIYKFSIGKIGKTKGKYTLKITKISQNDGDKGQDAPEDWDQPLSIDAGTYKNCYLGSVDESDDYAIKLQAGQRAVVKVIPSETLDVSVGKTEFEVENTNDNLKGEAEEITINADESGIYKFSVGKIGKTKGTYTLDISVE